MLRALPASRSYALLAVLAAAAAGCAAGPGGSGGTPIQDVVASSASFGKADSANAKPDSGGADVKDAGADAAKADAALPDAAKVDAGAVDGGADAGAAQDVGGIKGLPDLGGAAEAGSTPESACANGQDDDADGKTDCADPDCGAKPECQAANPPECASAAVIPPDGLCDVTLSGTSEGGGTALTSYASPAFVTQAACQPTLAMTGPEKVYVHAPAATKKVTATFTHSADLRLVLLETSGLCDAKLCVREVKGTATWYLEQGKTYYYIVDGVGGAAGSFQIAFACN